MGYISGLISVIVPVFNVKHYLDRCLVSIVNQTYSNVEIIIIDDGSNDGSGELCDIWSDRDKRIRVFHKKNGGLSSARNMGLEKARGEFIGFVDSDDYIKKDMYAVLADCMTENIDIVCCGRAVLQISTTNRVIDLCDMAPKKIVLSNIEAMRELLLKRYLSFSACTKLFRRELFEQVKFPEGKICEDIPVVYNVVKRSRRVVNIGKVMYFYCYREDSISRKPFEIKRLSYVLFVRDILKDIMINHPNLINEATALYIRNVVAIIDEIGQCKDRERYSAVRNRLKKVLLKMYADILKNRYISKEMKIKVLRILIFYRVKNC